MIKSVFQEFYNRYDKPKIEEITVGFSGIDPAQKAADEREFAEKVIRVVSSTSIDCGEIT